jgi:hypothetical protein
MTPFALERGSTPEGFADFGADLVIAANQKTAAEREEDGKVVEKRGRNEAQTVRSFRTQKPPRQAKSRCHRLPPVAAKVAW